MTNTGERRQLGMLTYGRALLINLQLPAVPWGAQPGQAAPPAGAAVLPSLHPRVVRGETYQVSSDTWTPQEKSLIIFNDVGAGGGRGGLTQSPGVWCHRASEAGNLNIYQHRDCWLNWMATSMGNIECYDTTLYHVNQYSSFYCVFYY